MASFDIIRAEFETLFNDNWIETPIAFDNLQEASDKTEFIRLTVEPITSLNNSWKCIRHDGLLSVQVFAQLDTGSGRAWQLADLVATLIENKRLNGVQTYASSALRIGENEYFYQINVNTRYTYFEREI